MTQKFSTQDTSAHTQRMALAAVTMLDATTHKKHKNLQGAVAITKVATTHTMHRRLQVAAETILNASTSTKKRNNNP